MARRVVDCHIHLYPPEVSADPAAWGAAHGEPWWTHCVAPPNRPSLQGWADVSQLLRDMDRAGIAQATLLGWYWERQETCDLQNGWFAEWTRAHPDRLFAFAAVQPNSGQRGFDATRRALDAGFCGIGEMLPAAQRFSFADEHWARLVALAAQYRAPINLHVTDPLLFASGSTGQPTPLPDFIRLARDFPDAAFILAHWGGGLPFYELNPRLRACLKNVHYDASASALLYDKRVFRRVVDLVGAERVLFGTDYPLLCYPRESRRPDFRRALDDALSAGLTDAELDLVLGGNFLRLLGR